MNYFLLFNLKRVLDKVAVKGKRSVFLAERARAKLARLKFIATAKKLDGILDSTTYPEFSSPNGAEKFIRSLRQINDLRYGGVTGDEK